MNISGDIQALQGLPRIQHIDLFKTQVSGDIQVFQALVQLKILNLAGTQISRNIQCQAFPAIARLQQGLKLLVSDIGAFQNLAELSFVNVAFTQVSGNIVTVNSTKSLMCLGMLRAKVWGGITAFREMSDLKNAASGLNECNRGYHRLCMKLISVGISSSRVSGDIAVFNSSDSLKNVYWYRTSVFGNSTAFAASPSLRLSVPAFHAGVGRH